MQSRRAWTVWLPLAVVFAWILSTAFVSVVLVAWGLAVMCAGAAVVRLVLAEKSPFVVRRRGLDASILVVFALALAFLATTARIG
jgi:hypothetical protein